MRAVRVHGFGGPEALVLEELPLPTPGPGELLVQVRAAGVGPWDAWVRSGKSVIEQPLPLTPGSDISGVVVQAREAPGFTPGQAVYGVTNTRFTGGYAEYALAQASMMAPRPARLTDVEAASVPVVAVTAQQMLFEHGHLRAGQRVLVHGAGGNVGAYALQLARDAGAEVIGTAVGASVAYARSLNAGRVIDAARQRFEEGLAPVDLVLDTVGGDVQSRSFAVLKRGGTLVSAVSEPDAELATLQGVRALFMLVQVRTDALKRLAQLLDAGQLQTHIGLVLPLAEARAAHEMLDGLRRRPSGKLVLDVAGSPVGFEATAGA